MRASNRPMRVRMCSLAVVLRSWTAGRICTRTQACHGDVDTCVNLCDDALATDYFSAVETISCQVAAPVCVGGDLSWAQCARDNGAGRVARARAWRRLNVRSTKQKR